VHLVSFYYKNTQAHYIKFLSVVYLGKSSLIDLSQTEHQFCVQKNVLLIHKVPLCLVRSVDDALKVQVRLEDQFFF